MVVYNQTGMQIYLGNALDVLKKLPENSIQCCVTSPPYWNLRDYSTEPQIWDGDSNCDHDWVIHHQNPKGGKNLPNNMPDVRANRYLQTTLLRNQGINTGFCSKCGAWKGSLGNEPDFLLYINNLCNLFDQVKRVLKDDGVCFVVIGDSYAGAGGMGSDIDNKAKKGMATLKSYSRNKVEGIRNKSLIQIPARFSIEMTNRGWILRNSIIWHKLNAQPNPAKDRFTVDYETIHFFSKNQKYKFNQRFESYAPASEVRYRQALRANRSYNTKKPYEKNTPYSGKYKRGQGAVSSRGDDADGLVVGGNNPKGRNKRCVWSIPTRPSNIPHFALFPLEIPRICILAGSDPGDIILDPFAGVMTTLLAAKQLNRQAIGIELNESYIKIGIKRLAQEYLPFKED